MTLVLTYFAVYISISISIRILKNIIVRLGKISGILEFHSENGKLIQQPVEKINTTFCS